MNKISSYWLIVVLLVGIAGAWLYFKYIYEPADTITINKRRNNDVIILKLPNSVDPDVFGPKYWQAFHTLAERIPCSICRDDAVPFISFFHDVVNQKTKKPIFDKENFNKHIDNIFKLQKA